MGDSCWFFFINLLRVRFREGQRPKHEHRTSNVQHPTSNVVCQLVALSLFRLSAKDKMQFNVQRSMFDVGRSSPYYLMVSYGFRLLSSFILFSICTLCLCGSRSSVLLTAYSLLFSMLSEALWICCSIPFSSFLTRCAYLIHYQGNQEDDTGNHDDRST